MQKVRTIERGLCLLVLAGSMAAAYGANDKPLAIDDLITRAKEERLREAQGLKDDADKGGAASPTVIPPPALVALYGVGNDMTAELSYDGQIHVIRRSGALPPLGPWREIEIRSSGVRLTSAAWYRLPGSAPHPVAGARPPAAPPASKRTGTTPPRHVAPAVSAPAVAKHSTPPRSDVATPPMTERTCIPANGCLLLSVVARPQKLARRLALGHAGFDGSAETLAAELEAVVDALSPPKRMGDPLPFQGKPMPSPSAAPTPLSR